MRRAGPSRRRSVPVPRAQRRHAPAWTYDCASQGPLLETLRTRVVPALLTALGMMLLAIGLLTYARPDHGRRGLHDARQPRPDRHRKPLTQRHRHPRPSPARSSSLRLLRRWPRRRPGTRLRDPYRRPALRIDLPEIVEDRRYPLCDVAMYLKLGPTGEVAPPTSTAMPAPACSCRSSTEIGGSRMRGMIGALVRSTRADVKLHLYQINMVRRTATPPTCTRLRHRARRSTG